MGNIKWKMKNTNAKHEKEKEERTTGIEKRKTVKETKEYIMIHHARWIGNENN